MTGRLADPLSMSPCKLPIYELENAVVDALNADNRLILASASPQRTQILHQLARAALAQHLARQRRRRG